VRFFPHALLAAAFVAIGLAASGAGAQDAISAAEKLLFQTDHLKNVAPSATLSYTFRKTGSAEAGFDDTVELRVRELDGAKQASVSFLSAERKTACPEVTRAEGNPVLLCFLERDIREMQRLTGGKSGYFRRAIRLALARSATVARTRLSFGGRELAGNEITVIPYADDPLKDRIGKYASKTYVFTLSVEVPGAIHSVRTFVPAPVGSSNEAPLLEERLTLVGRRARRDEKAR
jgi:hypothetical protein